MGEVTWLLGQHYDWYTDAHSKVPSQKSQQAFIDSLHIKFKYQHCTGSHTLYCSRLKIDSIENYGVDPSQKKKLMR